MEVDRRSDRSERKGSERVLCKMPASGGGMLLPPLDICPTGGSHVGSRASTLSFPDALPYYLCATSVPDLNNRNRNGFPVPTVARPFICGRAAVNKKSRTSRTSLTFPFNINYPAPGEIPGQLRRAIVNLHVLRHSVSTCNQLQKRTNEKSITDEQLLLHYLGTHTI